MRPFTLGALDFSPVFMGITAIDAILETLQLGRYLEDFGYSRYWISEHHDSAVAHSCPELLIPIIAGSTERMRVGVAGILLRLHSPLRVAKAFKLLQAVYPNRIDLGIARGGARHEITTLLRDGATHEIDFESKVEELLSYIRDESTIPVNPTGVLPAEFWMLGSNTTSMRVAASHGTAFCFAQFLCQEETSVKAVLATYNDNFTPSADLLTPRCSIAVAGICASTDRQAYSLLPTNWPISVLPTIVGSPRTCAEGLKSLRSQTGVTDFVFVDMCPLFQDKLTSYRLLSDTLL